MKKVLLATTNSGKMREMAALLAGLPVELVSPDAVADVTDVEETGSTFMENARLKASGYARQAGSLTIADDSGLEIAALSGRPGVLSARYGGDGTSFSQKMDMLLAEVEAATTDDRSARFVCAVAIADADGSIVFEAEGICTGRLARAPSGSFGFGYDPVFVPDGYNSTFGEMTEPEKRALSHRGRAFLQIIPFLRHFIAV